MAFIRSEASVTGWPSSKVLFKNPANASDSCVKLGAIVPFLGRPYLSGCDTHTAGTSRAPRFLLKSTRSQSGSTTAAALTVPGRVGTRGGGARRLAAPQELVLAIAAAIARIDGGYPLLTPRSCGGAKIDTVIETRRYGRLARQIVAVPSVASGVGAYKSAISGVQGWRSSGWGHKCHMEARR